MDGADRAHDSAERLQMPELCSMSALAAVVISAQLLALVVVLLSGDLTWLRLGITSLFVQWVALVSAGVLCASRAWLARLSPAAGSFCAWLLVTAIVAIFAVLAELTLAGQLGVLVQAWTGQDVLVRPRPADWTLVLRSTLSGGILAGMLLRYLFVQQHLRSREQSELRLRLEALQSRIRPHFLFNSMNIIASLIESDPQTAENVVEDLSELFRASLHAGNQVSLQEELDLCERYLRIEQLRLGDRLQVNWEVETIPHRIRIPLLTVQPLLENAIYHGIQPVPEGGVIHGRVRLTDSSVDISISNPLPPPDAAERHRQGNRMALNNIRSRLEVLYGKAASLDAREVDGQYCIRLSYPVAGGVGVSDEPSLGGTQRRHG